MLTLKVVSMCLFAVVAGVLFAALFVVATPIRVVNLQRRAKAERANMGGPIKCVCPECHNM